MYISRYSCGFQRPVIVILGLTMTLAIAMRVAAQASVHQLLLERILLLAWTADALRPSLSTCSSR